MSKHYFSQLRQHRLFPLMLKIGAALIVLFIISILVAESESSRKSVPLNIEKIMTNEAKAIAETKPTHVDDNVPNYSYQIQDGDNLSSIFVRLGVPYSDMLSVMETDQNHLTLDTLKPGNTLKIWLDEKLEHLTKLEVEFTLADKVEFTRNDDDGSYTFNEVNLPGVWKSYPLVGEIHGSFSTSVYKYGVSGSETAQITQLLKDKLNFVRDLRAGDKFEILQKRQFINGVASGNREIDAIRIYNRGSVISAYLHSDGQYYDRNGDSLQNAFLRWPLAKHYRISSPFDPNRLHPVTHRLAPHNGADIACPSGTDVIATGDGIVTLTTDHPYAGKYIVIQHGSTYRTRYLHLSKILVRQGQAVHRGQVIAKSGATGRVTGPHLHYEFIIRNKPVNFLTAKIPMATSISKKEKPAFEKHVKAVNQEFKMAKQVALEQAKLEALVNN
ncbi:peptidoglycan DD-metalloendopeptidase family protein [Vibrio rumoiensis]|uniref:Peptidase M23 n=1 Tax=Vibrio rumoiensis 1S-45 TaxID=1188252 RepID=A0A1E5E148_9VIBR|nr:peptidoglycan DD-metalloendopeptidase family protein [Vibrio rumoiensis]OEF24281.1 peptidase M23 [Vibrio rumoiensis 1S-45]